MWRHALPAGLLALLALGGCERTQIAPLPDDPVLAHLTGCRVLIDTVTSAGGTGAFEAEIIGMDALGVLARAKVQFDQPFASVQGDTEYFVPWTQVKYLQVKQCPKAIDS